LNHLRTEYSVKPELDYPFEKRWSPSLGDPIEVAEGVYWLRQPLPIALDHINLWILRDGDGWTIVDSGFDHQDCKDVWEQVFSDFLKPQMVKRIIITHYHPDHIGLASWLAKRCNCLVWISRGEFNRYHEIITRDPIKNEQELSAYSQLVGYDQDTQKDFKRFFSAEKNKDRGRVIESICHFIEDKQAIEIDGLTWRVVTGNGHSPEHVCLYCPQKKVMISGDQAIARISSNVSVYPADMNANPLNDWLNSCAKLQRLIPSDTMILPAHQEPFIGINERMQQLIDDHTVDLNRLRVALREPLSVVDARQILFNRELSLVDTILATGETLSHLNYLKYEGEVSVSYNVEGKAGGNNVEGCAERNVAGLAEYRLK